MTFQEFFVENNSSNVSCNNRPKLRMAILLSSGEKQMPSISKRHSCQKTKYFLFPHNTLEKTIKIKISLDFGPDSFHQLSRTTSLLVIKPGHNWLIYTYCWRFGASLCLFTFKEEPISCIIIHLHFGTPNEDALWNYGTEYINREYKLPVSEIWEKKVFSILVEFLKRFFWGKI